MNALDRLTSEGDVPARFRFLASVAEAYGAALLLETSLPWVTLREAPGNALLVTVAELILRAKAKAEVLIGYGGTPWNAEVNARSCFPNASKDALVLPVSMDGQPEPGSLEDEDQSIEGSLEEHFKGRRSYERDKDPKNAVLLMATLEAIASAWGVAWEAVPATWARQKRKLFGRLSRPE